MAMASPAMVSLEGARTGVPVEEGFMENGDQEFWKALLTNRNLRTRFIRDLEVQSIASRSTEDLATRYRQEEMMPRKSSRAPQRAASSLS